MVAVGSKDTVPLLCVNVPPEFCQANPELANSPVIVVVPLVATYVPPLSIVRLPKECAPV